MRLDHVSYAAGPEGLDAAAAQLTEKLQATSVKGGVHPTFGTQNRVISLADGRYVEVVVALDHPSAEKASFGQAVRARSELGGGWLGWVVAVDDIAPFEERLGRPRTLARRIWPDGFELTWDQIGVSGLANDPQLPFFVHWTSDATHHPSQAAKNAATIKSLQIAGSPDRVSDWLGEPKDHPLEQVDVQWSAPKGQPGLLSVTFDTPNGVVTI